MADNEVATIDQYIAQFPADVRERLEQFRSIIEEAAPEATQSLAWGMPTYKLSGNLVHFAAAKKHVGLYPGAEGVAQFLDRLGDYRTSKGAIQFPYDRPLPADLIRDIVVFRVGEQKAKAAGKTKAKAAGKTKATPA